MCKIFLYDCKNCEATKGCYFCIFVAYVRGTINRYIFFDSLFYSVHCYFSVITTNENFVINFIFKQDTYN